MRLRPRCATVVYGLIWGGLALPGTADMSLASGADDHVSPGGIVPELERRNLLEESSELPRLFPEWYFRREEWRETVGENLRLELSTSYDAVAQGYVSSERAFGTMAGDFTLNGRYLAFGKKRVDPVFLAFRARYRSALFDLDPPSQIRPDRGLLWGTVDGFSDAGFQVPDFYLTQELFDKRLLLRYGQLGVDSLLDGHGLASGKRYFLSQGLSGHPGVAFPSYGAGLVARWKSSRHWDLGIGASNVQGTPANDEVSFNLDSEALFQALQIGFDLGGADRQKGRLQLMAWHSDALPDTALEEGKGIAVTLEQKNLPYGGQLFARYAFSHGEATRTDHDFSIGVGAPRRTHDFWGVGAAVGRSVKNSHIWQGAVEVFYRWQVTQEFHITPDVQIIAGDSLEGTDSFRTVIALRGGLTF